MNHPKSQNAVEEIRDIADRANRCLEQYREELNNVIQDCGGTRLANATELLEFREQFMAACKLLRVGPLSVNGRRGSLQIAKRSRDRAWTSIYVSKNDYKGTGAPSNTIPRMKLG